MIHNYLQLFMNPLRLQKKLIMIFALISQWAKDWMMSFNLDPQKQTVELLFSKKRHQADHSFILFNNILFNNISVKKVDKHKHIGIILYSKLSFLNSYSVCHFQNEQWDRLTKLSLNIYLDAI